MARKKFNFILFLLLAGLLPAAAVSVDGTTVGRTFDGIGAVSAGANSRLLIDYSEPYRSDILDFLFKPKFGASFHYLKVEMGGGTNSTSGAEPSHVIDRSELTDPVSRGYEFWLLKEARQRNPEILLDFLPWSFPYWLGTPFGQKQDFADYFTAFLIEARDQWGVHINRVSAAKNESYTDLDWIKNYLRPTMDAAGFSSVKIQAPDGHQTQAWQMFNTIVGDPAYNALIDAVGYHYIDQENKYPTADMIATGKTLWDSEDSIDDGSWYAGREVIRRMNKLYINGKITQMQLWCPIDSCAEGAFLGNVGAMQGDTPWSGYYATRPATWCVAHFTQFTKPGWVFIDSGCGVLSGNGNYTTLKDPDSSHWSMILYAEQDETLTLNLTGGLSTGTVHVWKSTPSNQFIRIGTMVPSSGSLNISLSADSVYTLTTTTGQQKGMPPHAIPANTAFPLPYAEDFESYAVGATPRWISDMQGTFEVAACKGGRGGRCLQQMLPQIGDTWAFDWVNPHAPMTLFGSMAWKNYEASADVFIDSGEVYLAVRKGDSQKKCGYAFVINKYGNWRLSYDNITDPAQTLKSGTISPFDGDRWHNLKVRAVYDQIDAYVDNVRMTSVIHTSRSEGQPCVGGSFNLNQYDNIRVYPAGPGVDKWRIIDDTDASLKWYQWWGNWPSPVYYNGTCKFTDIAGTAVEFPFYGRYAKVYASQRNDLGYLNVSVDGVFQTAVDCYSATTIDSAVIYQTGELTLGDHVLRLEAAGTKNQASTGTEIVLDAFASSETSGDGWCIVQPLAEPAAPVNYCATATATASSRWSSTYSASKAKDGNWSSTRWNAAAGDVNGAWLEMNFNTSRTFGQAKFQQFGSRIQNYKIQYYDGTWKDAFAGGPMGTAVETVAFDTVTGTGARLLVDTAADVPSIYEFEIYPPAASAFQPLYVDLNGDGLVNLGDLAQLAAVWLYNDCGASCDCDKADLYHDGRIDLSDFAILAGQLVP